MASLVAHGNNIIILYDMSHYTSTDVKNALHNIHQDYAFVPIDKETKSIAFVCNRFYACLIAKERGLNDNSSKYTHSKINNLCTNDIIHKGVICPKIKIVLTIFP